MISLYKEAILVYASDAMLNFNEKGYFGDILLNLPPRQFHVEATRSRNARVSAKLFGN
jgi:hypothetical protein